MEPSTRRLLRRVLSTSSLLVLAPPLAAVLAVKLQAMHASGELEQLLRKALETQYTFDKLTLLLAGAAAAGLILYRLLRGKERPVYLLDFHMSLPPDEWKMPKDLFLKASGCNPDFSADDMKFQERIVSRSGLGEETCCPPWLMGHPFSFDMTHSRLEFEVTCFGAIEALLNRTGVSPKQITALIVNSSLFNPTPSLSAMVMNRFKLPAGTINYNLGGMGCSASLIAIDLARQVLQLKPGGYVLVVSHENITNNWYPGQDRSMLVPNCIFRANGAAMLLTNKASESWRAKYKLTHLVRVNMAGTEKGYSCVYQMEDAHGEVGVRLSKDLTSVAAQALMTNLGRLGPLILPAREKLVFAFNMLGRKIYGKKSIKSYVPDFKTAVSHICIHSGGRAVIDGMQRVLGMTDDETEPSRATLYKWGNVSSSSVWYVLAYIETFKGLRAGQKVWQLSFGSGFKCNSAIWTANRTFKFEHPCWSKFDQAKMRLELAKLAKEIAEEKAARKAAGLAATAD